MSSACTSAIRVLVVDDCADTASTIAWLLSASGFHVLEATSAEQALAQAEHFHPDVVLLDLSLKGSITGLEVARQLGMAPHQTRVAAVTGWAGESDRREAAAAGCEAYFLKPVDIETLGRFIRGEGEHVPNSQRTRRSASVRS